MYTKIRNILCHPSRLGLYFKDAWYICFAYFFVFFGIVFGVITLKDMSRDNFDSADARILTYDLVNEVTMVGSGFDGAVLYGNGIHLERDTYSLYYLEEYNPSFTELISTSFVIVLGKKEAKLYLGSQVLSTYSYTNYHLGEFTVEDVKDGSIEALVRMDTFMYQVLESCNTSYSIALVTSELVTLLSLYIACLITCFIIAFFVNPAIEARYRIRIVVYASLSFFLISLFQYLFSFDFLTYVALLIPVVYTIVAFSHIRRVAVKGRF